MTEKEMHSLDSRPWITRKGLHEFMWAQPPLHVWMKTKPKTGAATMAQFLSPPQIDGGAEV